MTGQPVRFLSGHVRSDRTDKAPLKGGMSGVRCVYCRQRFTSSMNREHAGSSVGRQIPVGQRPAHLWPCAVARIRNRRDVWRWRAARIDREGSVD